jgi:UDP-GlcNAc:undecaprenyl-phosphate/decaprenyl-phosphate GlcNAc-1-phosphate transferase
VIENWELVYLPLVTFGLAVACTLVVRTAARRYGWVVAPRPDRWHETPTALYGGVAMAVALVGSLGPLAGMRLLNHLPAAAILTAAVALFAVGVIDDAVDIGPVGKFILQLSAGTVLVLAEVVFPLTPWIPVNVLVTLFWFVGIVNAANLLDNMDGVTAGVMGIAAAGFGVLYVAAGEPVLALVGLATAGTAAGFLVFNVKPASIFMGDGGSLFLGALLAGLAAAYPGAAGISGSTALVIAALVLTVPILDTALVTVTRTLNNRRVLVGGRDHSTHRLVAMGFSEGKAALVLYAFGALAFGVAWLVGSTVPAAGMWLGLVFLTGALVLVGYLGKLYSYEDSLPGDRRRRGVLFRNILLKRRGLELLLDVVLFGVAYYGAFVLYYEGGIPSAIAAVASSTLAIVIVLKLAAFHYFQVYRGTWSRTGLADVHRIGKAALLSGTLVVTALFLIARGGDIPRTVFVLDFLLTAGLAMMARSSFRSLDRFRQRLRADTGTPVLIYGAGPEADLVLNALRAIEEYRRFRVVGFLDDREAVGTLIHGIPVLGSSHQLSEVAKAVRPCEVILASSLPAGEPGRVFQECCGQLDVELLSLNFSLRVIERARPAAAEAEVEVARAKGGESQLVRM